MRSAIEEQCDAHSNILVEPGDCRFATDPTCRLISRNLQSCVALAVHVPKHNLAALLRFSLPASSEPSTDHDVWFSADKAIPSLFARLRAMGVMNREMSVYAVGGATSVPSGKSNELAMRRFLWREGVLLQGEEIGGTSSRSIWFEAGSGRIVVRTQSCAVRPAASRQGDKLWHFAS